MLPSARWQLALIYSNSGKWRETQVFKSLSLGGTFIFTGGCFSSVLQLIHLICFIRLWLYNWGTYKKTTFHYTGGRYCHLKRIMLNAGILFLTSKMKKIWSNCKTVYWLSSFYSGVKNKGLSDHKIVFLFPFCCNRARGQHEATLTGLQWQSSLYTLVSI